MEGKWTSAWAIHPVMYAVLYKGLVGHKGATNGVLRAEEVRLNTLMVWADSDQVLSLLV